MDRMPLNKDAVSQKILETTRETARLKHELEALIASGISCRPPIQSSSIHNPPLESTNKVQIIKSYDAKHSQHVQKPAEGASAKTEPQVVSPKKPKTYNVDEARNYIRKQKGKRIEERKNRRSYTQIASEMRKEKLQELEQKAREIVKKNIEAKRARSTSREPPIVRSRPGNSIARSRSNSRDKKADESVIVGFNRAEKTRKYSGTDRSRTRKAEVLDPVERAKMKTYDPNLLYPPKPVYGVREVESTANMPDIPESVTYKYQKRSSSNPKLPSQTSSSEHSKSATEKPPNKDKSKLNITSNITLREAVEPTIKEQVNLRRMPEWLQEQPQTDPYNFMNTVKRQLRYMVDEKKPILVDIGVQGNVSDNLSCDRSSKKTDLGSFISHRCANVNLDPKAVPHVDLDRNREFYMFKDDLTKTNKPTSCSENDSDTSKNIPSLSSESGSSLRRNAEIIRESYAVSDLKPLENAPPNLDVGKVQDIRLSDQKTSLLTVPTQEEVEKIKKQLFKDSDQYSSDFIPTDLSRSRESILSFNCAKISPNKVPLLMSEPGGEHVIVSEGPSEHLQTEDAFLADRDISEDSWKNNKTVKSGAYSNKEKPQVESGSLKYSSLFSTLRSSTNKSEFKQSDVGGRSESRSQVTKSASSESLKTVPSEIRKRDGFPEELSVRGSFTGSNSSRMPSSESISEAIKPTDSRDSSGLQETYSERPVFQETARKEKNPLSKSESNIYANKENVFEPKKRNRKGDERQALMRNITIRSADQSNDNLNNTNNEIHLKFEAEIHLLTDFNESIRRFSEIEKAFESLRAQSHTEMAPQKVAQNKDTQTSLRFSKPTRTTSQESVKNSSNSISEIRSERVPSSKGNPEANGIMLDLTQASDVNSALTTVNLDDSLLDFTSDKTSSMTHFSQLNLGDSLKDRRELGDENVVFKSVVGMSLRMFDQLIKDEDARIENWKKIVKIREQALLDRTRGELVWLEMQKKQLIETGKLSEASLIKKKQRGILLKHQQEKHEMQRLKQMQKEDSHNRKTLLKKERNQIKKQLLSDNMLSKMRPGSHRDRGERRLSGPFKVIQASATTVNSETSLSKGTDQEIKSITTRTSRTHSVVNILSETSDHFHADADSFDFAFRGKTNITARTVSNMKKTLLMREHALAKRRKTVEELLQWHKKLLDEEKAIEDLESKIGTIISKIPSQGNVKTPKSVSANTSGEEITPSMSQLALERLPTPPTETNLIYPKSPSSISSELTKNIPQEEIHSEDSNRVVSSANNNYSTDFDVESVQQNSDDQSSVSSISQLIEDFSKIEGNIINLGLVPKRLTPDEEEVKSEISSHSAEVTSQIEAKNSSDEENSNVNASVIIVEQPSATDDESKVKTSVKIKDILSETSSSVSEQLVASNNVPDEDDTNINETIKESSEIIIDNQENLNEVSEEQHVELEDSGEELRDDITPQPEPASIISVGEDQPLTSIDNSAPLIEKITPLIDDGPSLTEEISTSKEVEQIENDVQQPSTSTRQDTDTPVLSPNSKEDISSIAEKKDRDSLSAAESEPQPPSVIESFENKTDEEKAASLSRTERLKSSLQEESQPSTSGHEAIQKDSSTEYSSIEEAVASDDALPAQPEEESEDKSTSVAASQSSSEIPTVASQKSPLTSSAKSSGSAEESASIQKPPAKTPSDIKKYVQEIFNVTSTSRAEKSPKMQDFCLITYDTSPVPSPEAASPLDERKPFSLGTEAEELHRKQLAIEQEIKLLKEQQQKEAASPIYIREIPNKPPPPYTPPSKSRAIKTPSVVPATKEQVEQITEYSAKIIHKAYLSNNLDNITISDNTLNLIAKNIDKGCYKYVFDLCKEVAKDHYGQFVEESGPSWLQLDKKPPLAPTKPLDVNGLKRLMSRKLFEMFGFEKRETRRENAIMKWSRKKRDHVDEVLVQEMLAEEGTWTNFERDEALVKDRLTNEIMEMLLKETTQVVKEAFLKKTQCQ